ncbi:dihydrodipicolinate synthase family protein [Puia sp.]|uniref:dihydrodipicolinate synthase family protein n=1 Tax=Puia sp. TaxID=2045100 RepID=UPI002F41B35E
MNKKYSGIIVPAITPLNAARTLDTKAVEKLLPLFPHSFILGTTGEFPSLSGRLKEEYIRLAARIKKPGQHLYVGISSNCFADSVEYANIAAEAGADLVVANLPSYYQLSETQMRNYFQTLADAVPLPLVIYNIPSTTHHSIPLPLIDELSHHPNIAGTKDSERNDERLKQSLQLWANRKDFSHFLGWAAKSAEALLNGGDGLVPSTANLDPGIYTDMEKAAAAGNSTELNRLQELSDSLGNSYQGHGTGETIGRLKRLMHDKGLCQPYTMLPL